MNITIDYYLIKALERLILPGLFLPFLGLIITTAGILLSTGKSVKSDVKAGGVIFLGPIPLVFGSDTRTALIAATLGLTSMAAYYFLTR